MSRRSWMIIGFVMVLAIAACGGDDGADDNGTTQAPGNTTPTTTAAAPSGGGGGGGGGGAAGGELVFGDETITSSGARCFLQEQDAFGGGTIHATAQATGVNAAGEDVLIDWTRFGEDTQFAGDDVLVNIGPEEFASRTDIGTLTIDGSTVRSPDLTFTIFRDTGMVEIPGSFEINC